MPKIDQEPKERVRGLKLEPGVVFGLRAKLKMTQQQAAEAAHVQLRQWQRWEAGDQSIPGAVWELLTLKAGVGMDWRPADDETPPSTSTPPSA